MHRGTIVDLNPPPAGAALVALEMSCVDGGGVARFKYFLISFHTSHLFVFEFVI